MIPAAEQGNEDIPVPVLGVVCCAQHSVGKQSMGKRGSSSIVVLLEVIQKDATGARYLFWQRICSIFLQCFIILLLLAVRMRTGQKNQSSYGNFKAQGSASFVGKSLPSKFMCSCCLF